MSPPAVSVVIPTCNRATSVVRAVRSVLGQTFSDLELVVVDDASDDEIESRVGGLGDPRLQVVRLSRRRGGGAARNVGIEASRAPLVAFLDDDDAWMPEKLARQVEAYRRDAAVGLVYTGYDKIRALDETRIGRAVPEYRGDLASVLLRHNCIGTTSSPLVRRDVLDQAGRFDPALRSLQDWDLWLRIARFSIIDFVRDPLVRRYVHRRRITDDLDARLAGAQHFLRKHRSEIAQDARALSRHLATIGHLYCRRGDTRSGLRYLARSLRQDPANFFASKHLAAAALGARGYRVLASAHRAASQWRSHPTWSG